jgi:hypothetical protein
MIDVAGAAQTSVKKKGALGALRLSQSRSAIATLWAASATGTAAAT